MATQFYADFNAIKNEIEDKINGIKTVDDKQECLEDLSRLSLKCKESLYMLPQYDQRIYNSTLEELEGKIQSKKVVKKFAFSSRRVKSQQPKTGEKLAKENGSQFVDFSTVSRDEFVVADKREESVVDECMMKDLMNLKISNISQSALSFRRKEYSVVRISDVDESFVYIRNVVGPIYLTNITNSTIMVGCHQFRMHQSENVNVYINCQSKRPIIENSRAIKFGPMPSGLTTGPVYPIEGVDDFNWIRPEQSENWAWIDIQNEQSSLSWLNEIENNKVFSIKEIKSQKIDR